MDLQKEAGMTPTPPPTPTREGRAGSRRPGAGSQEGGRLAKRQLPHPHLQPPAARLHQDHLLFTGPQPQPSSPACSGGGEGSGEARRKGQPALDNARRSWVLLSAPLFCGLTFLLTACCSFHFVVLGFFILFSQEEGRKRSVYEVQ